MTTLLSRIAFVLPIFVTWMAIDNRQQKHDADANGDHQHGKLAKLQNLI
ncbi:hypothetical protein RMSM_06911 [Rhodopirellula maiorica SM1]|uniref:Uncharacterized protein n=1 Tax=Rhodopirellula maiorica SM1 TaxID=1265738 RepID=M5RLA3_9BACT|nr:hypothetical protein [Rhodopirellula maiorica]EMI16157.1 hypothetical protein RMSM_06911 [Rhodopirellula maiorica SM1]